MDIYYGKGVVSGVAIGKLCVIQGKKSSLEKKSITDADAEMERFSKAREKALCQLDELYKSALEQVGEEKAMIFDVHKLMLDDLDYLEEIERCIRSEFVNAEYAVSAAGQMFSDVFAAMDDE